MNTNELRREIDIKKQEITIETNELLKFQENVENLKKPTVQTIGQNLSETMQIIEDENSSQKDREHKLELAEKAILRHRININEMKVELKLMEEDLESRIKQETWDVKYAPVIEETEDKWKNKYLLEREYISLRQAIITALDTINGEQGFDELKAITEFSTLIKHLQSYKRLLLDKYRAGDKRQWAIRRIDQKEELSKFEDKFNRLEELQNEFKSIFWEIKGEFMIDAFPELGIIVQSPEVMKL